MSGPPGAGRREGRGGGGDGDGAAGGRAPCAGSGPSAAAAAGPGGRTGLGAPPPPPSQSPPGAARTWSRGCYPVSGGAAHQPRVAGAAAVHHPPGRPPHAGTSIRLPRVGGFLPLKLPAPERPRCSKGRGGRRGRASPRELPAPLGLAASKGRC